jgi:hypothetical protein
MIWLARWRLILHHMQPEVGRLTSALLRNAMNLHDVAAWVLLALPLLFIAGLMIAARRYSAGKPVADDTPAAIDPSPVEPIAAVLPSPAAMTALRSGSGLRARPGRQSRRVVKGRRPSHSQAKTFA